MPKLSEDAKEMIVGCVCGIAMALIMFGGMDLICKMFKL